MLAAARELPLIVAFPVRKALWQRRDAELYAGELDAGARPSTLANPAKLLHNNYLSDGHG